MIKDNKILKASRSKYKQIYVRKQKSECNYTLSTTHSQESIEESVLTKVESQKKKKRERNMGPKNQDSMFNPREI